MTTTVLPAVRSASARSGSPRSAGYKVDISRGERIGRVSSEWFSRPDDERFLSLGALHAAVRVRAERATARTVETKALRVEASRDNAERLAAFDERPFVFDAAEVARAGAFISMGSAGELRVERGYVRPEDELPVEPEPDAEQDGTGLVVDSDSDQADARFEDGASAPAEPEEDEGLKGDEAADRVVPLKKPEMAAEAQTLLAGSGWLPEPLRTAGRTLFAVTISAGDGPAAIDGEQVVDDVSDDAEDEQAGYHAIAAE